MTTATATPTTPAHHIHKIAKELNLSPAQVNATASLLADGGTVPFIARYRKEATNSLDEVAVTAIRDRLGQLADLDARRSAILDSLTERKLLTPDLQTKIDAAETMSALEDVYQPFRPKRRTRAMAAKERGLDPLATLLLTQNPDLDPLKEAARFVTPASSTIADDLKVPDVAAALQGARDIIAEKISDDPDTRAALRKLFQSSATITSTVIPGKEEEGAKFKDYFDWSEPITSVPSHRLLAIRRGAAEGFLLFSIQPPQEDALAILESRWLQPNGASSSTEPRMHMRGSLSNTSTAPLLNPSADQLRLAIKDSYKRLLSLSMETEARLESKKRADTEAIQVFATNLRQLLLASPLGQKRILALDPGFRTGCKTVALGPEGQLLHHTVIYPDQGAQRTKEAADTIQKLITQYNIEAIAIGNGTASRETESFIRKLNLRIPTNAGISHVPEGQVPPPSAAEGAPIPIVVVSESGASIYSASEVAREEFPDLDLTVRGAVSIGRRLADPLAELVKLDPKSIGVGQYQHDVDQDALKKSLDDVVISAVNAVGVDVNTASKQLLTYVSGLNPSLAQNIVTHRDQNGPFKSRKDLLNVPRLGDKTFEQAAGFLRVRHPDAHPLDASAVHPESYPVVESMAKDLKCTVSVLLNDPNVRGKIDKVRYITPQVGLPTLTDILTELAKPGRDPRTQFEPFNFAEGITKLEDLKPGLKLPGIVTNVTAFGAFVDIGVHQDGLVHISQLADRYVKDPHEVVKAQQRVTVTVLEVDLPRKRIALTLRTKSPTPQKPAQPQSPTQVTPPSKPRPKPVPAPKQDGWFTAALKDAKKR